jgi:hypothetical protein
MTLAFPEQYVSSTLSLPETMWISRRQTVCNLMVVDDH